jgi:hypothetical protein
MRAASLASIAFPPVEVADDIERLCEVQRTTSPGTRPPCRHLFIRGELQQAPRRCSEVGANLLIGKERKFATFSECLLIEKGNLLVLQTAA